MSSFVTRVNARNRPISSAVSRGRPNTRTVAGSDDWPWSGVIEQSSGTGPTWIPRPNPHLRLPGSFFTRCGGIGDGEVFMTIPPHPAMLGAVDELDSVPVALRSHFYCQGYAG